MVVIDFGNGLRKYSTCSSLTDLRTEENFPVSLKLLLNGRYCGTDAVLSDTDSLLLTGSLLGGKGGFGSMLRSIGAQIEATTNNDACRDLSGKRLRDVKCEKLLKEWADKKAKEKDDRKERKRQRIERILEGPSRIKAEDNTYISEMRSMSETVESAIACAIADDAVIQHVKPQQLPKTKKWFDDDGESSEDGEEDGMEGREEGPSGEASSSGGDEGSPAGETGVEVLRDKEMEVSSDIEATKFNETADPPKEDSSKADAPIPETIPKSTVTETPVDTSNNEIPSSTETSEKKTPIEDVEWRHFPTPETLLEELGADCLKDILASMGMKCGGTPAARAERLHSVRDLESIPSNLLASSGKKRKPRNTGV